MKSNKVILPFRYAGGKYYALKKLEYYWNLVEHQEYREPFFGGGSVFWAKIKSKTNWINDIDKDLISTLKVIKNTNTLKELIKLVGDEEEATKDKYTLIKEMKTKNKIEAAYKFYYLNRTSYSGKMTNPSWGYRPKRSVPPKRWKEKLVPASNKLKDVKITSLDFEEVIKAPSDKKVLMFVDPPYYLDSKKSHYKNGFTTEDHLRLCKILKKTRHKFILTYDNHPEIIKLYSWAKISNINFYYRQDNSKNNANKRKMGEELIITNFEI